MSKIIKCLALILILTACDEPKIEDKVIRNGSYSGVYSRVCLDGRQFIERRGARCVSFSIDLDWDGLPIACGENK